MNEQETQRLAFLQKGSCAPVDYISDYYRLACPAVRGTWADPTSRAFALALSRSNIIHQLALAEGW